MMTPTIHSNGTSRQELVRQLEEACNAIRQAERALAEAAPNGRDYYPQGDDAIKAAQQQHFQRQDRLQSVRSELEIIWEKIQESP
jgi:hypothetical protein